MGYRLLSRNCSQCIIVSANSEDAILDAALALPPAQRPVYLDRVCAANPSLRQLVEGLLLAHEHALAREPGNTCPPGPTVVVQASPLEKPGDRIGRYKLLQQIGEGGWGVVYMADQEEPVRRRVALKVIKPGMDTKQVLARFEAERQALALMDHPNIAKVHDGGATDNGRPYFVMELVRGIKITDYCDQHQLPTAKRLELFISVCKAIQHAHQKGIIHRDIKPSNILVTLHDPDSSGVPKVIDFGIAKATEQRLTDKTLFTALDQFIGTPAYMSPEQAEMSGLDIDTRSDIYSLGVLLYELLTGKTPFDAKEMAAAGVEGIRRLIRERDPLKPSTRLRTLPAAEQTTVARCRQLDPPRLIHLVRGDLDWIVMKCLEKDRTRRYETANGLAHDIERHLRDEPITARPPSRRYQFQKLVRRNKFAFAAAGTVLAALVLGLGLAIWQFLEKSKAYQQTKIEAAKARQVAQFLKNMLAGVGPSAALGRDTAMLREILDKTTDRVGKDLKDQPQVEAELLHTLGQVYRLLGQSRLAENLLRQAVAIRTKEFGRNHPDVAASLDNLALALQEQGKFVEAERMHREALLIRRTLLGEAHPDVAASLNNLGLVLWKEGKFVEAEAIQRQALALKKKVFGDEHPDVAVSINNIALDLEGEGKLSEAEGTQREALRMRRKLLGDPHPDVAASLNNLGLVLWKEARLAESEAVQREALEMKKRLFGTEHAEVAASINNLAILLQEQGKLAEAEAAHREALNMRKKVRGPRHAEVASSLNNLALVLQEQGRLVEAETMQREAMVMQENLLGEHPYLASSLDNLAMMLRDQGKLAEAETFERKALAMRKKLLGEEHPDVAGSLDNLALILQDRGMLAEAEANECSALLMRKELLGNEHPDVLDSLDNLSRMLFNEGRLAEAEPLAWESLILRQKKFPDDWPTFRASSLLGAILLGQNQCTDAEPVLLAGYAGLNERETRVPPQRRGCLKEAAQWLVQLYEQSANAEEAAEWNKTVVQEDGAAAIKEPK
jgi:serine/threonine protein kinase/tetratricopeptide (TPR) repeat protein